MASMSNPRDISARLRADFTGYSDQDDNCRAAADLIDAQAAQIAELEAEMSDWRNGDLRGVSDHMHAFAEKCEAHAQLLAEVKEVVRPFAEEAESILDHVANRETLAVNLLGVATTSYFTVGQLRAARSLLSKLEELK